jgi:TolA-binding protein
MPKPMQFKAGSIVYFQGDIATAIYILQSGKVSLNYHDVETGEDIHDPVSPGEFFGVKSALGRYPREENAIAIQDTATMMFTVPEFEALAQANTRIIMKMLKVFSTQLRRVHQQVSNLVNKTEGIDPETGLFKVGEYYLKNKRFSQARYVFSRYLTYYPSGHNADKAAKYLEMTESAGGVPPRAAAATTRAAVTIAQSGTVPQSGSAVKAYQEALSLVSQEKYQQAYLAFKKIIDTNEDMEYTAKSSYEIGRCFFHLNKFDECIKYYTGMITKYPRHPDLGSSLFFMGQSYEKLNKKDQALTFYKKILTMITDESDAVHIKAKRALAALGV